MNNQQFLDTLRLSFVKFLGTHSRSNEKLKILHGSIAHDLSKRLGSDYEIKSLGYGTQSEGKIQGRYINKNVDITIFYNGKPIAGIAIKFVMQNYAQNANNYFENMLGETANIRSNNIPYFQIFIIPSQLPYYKSTGDFSKWEKFNLAHFNKYLILSQDNNENWLHSPTKTLLYVIDLPNLNNTINKVDYTNQYTQLNNSNLLIVNTSSLFANQMLGSNVILNDYDSFMEKVVHRILSE